MTIDTENDVFVLGIYDSIAYVKRFPKNLRTSVPMMFVTLFLIHIFFMFYNLEKWAPFGWDQVDNAWAAMRIITEHKYPLVGMVAKQNTGIFIGPLYYYFVSFFYFLTRLDPIAAPIIAGVTSIFSFLVIYFVTSKVFNSRIALMSCFVYTFSSFIITSERVQWPVNFIAPLSLLILYFLYQTVKGDSKYFIHMGALVGLSFHIHFTSVFYPIIILLSLPFIPRSKQTVKHIVLGLIIGGLFFIPQIIYYLQNGQSHALSNYAQTSYHGFHFRRMFQLTSDAFIKFQSVLMTPYVFVQHISFLFLPTFLFLYRKKLGALIALWFLVPWVVFSTYSGEISDYYFSLQSYLAIIILAFLTLTLWDTKKILIRILVAGFWIYWTTTNIKAFTNINPGSLPEKRASALDASKTARIINFTEGDPESYLYYYYMYRKGEWLPYQL